MMMTSPFFRGVPEFDDDAGRREAQYIQFSRIPRPGPASHLAEWLINKLAFRYAAFHGPFRFVRSVQIVLKMAWIWLAGRRSGRSAENRRDNAQKE